MALLQILVPDLLWEELRPLIPVRPRRFRYPGRRPYDDRDVLEGILFVLRWGIPWRALPQEPGKPSGKTCWRRFTQWQQAGVWEQLVQRLQERLAEAELLEWRRSIADATIVAAKRDLMKGALGGRGSVAAGLSIEGGPDGDVVRSDRCAQARAAGGGAGSGVRRAA